MLSHRRLVQNWWTGCWDLRVCFRAARLGSCFHRYHKSFGSLKRMHYNHVSVYIRIGYAQAEQRYCLYFGQIELGYARI